jgi:hypothetical protein
MKMVWIRNYNKSKFLIVLNNLVRINNENLRVKIWLELDLKGSMRRGRRIFLEKGDWNI